ERPIGAKDRPDHLNAASDQQVVAWAKQGHDAAFRELVRRYERPVFSLLYRMVRDRALAEDLAQETFIKVLNGIKSYRPEFKVSSYVEIADMVELALRTVKTYIQPDRNEVRGYRDDRRE